jgi:hypothetical protein
VLAFLFVWGMYALGNPQVTLIGETSHGSQFLSVLNNLPIRHPFSYSAQSRQLSAKVYYLWTYAPAFCLLLPAIFVSELVLRIRDQVDHTRSFITGALLALVFGALFLQSTLPYYLIHVLPLITLTSAVHMQAWYRTALLHKVLPVAGLLSVLAVLGTSGLELHRAQELGRQLTVENTAAVQAAIEQASRQWNSKDTKPLILGQGPALHDLLRDTSYRVMSEAFLFFPERAETTETVLRRMGVDYIIDYHRPMTPEYQAAVTSLGIPVFRRSGWFLDRSADYFEGKNLSLDTLTLYQVHNE